MRLDKYLSEMGTGTRSELKKEIKAGNVTVDGLIVKDPGTSVSAGSSVVFRGRPVVFEEFVYYMLNKPSGIISASEDSRETTVVDLITERKRKDLFPVGRLDRDTVGLLIITNDGEMAHRLLSPKHHVDKLYYAKIDGDVNEEDVRLFSEGLRIDDDLTCLPAELTITGREETESGIVTDIEVVIREGKFHQIKRMFRAVGKEVLYLKRLSMGPVRLDPQLEEGSFRRLTDEELTSLKAL